LIKLNQRDYQAAFTRTNAVVAGKAAALESVLAQLALQQALMQQRSAGRDVKSAQPTFAATDADRCRTLATSTADSRRRAALIVIASAGARRSAVGIG